MTKALAAIALATLFSSAPAQTSTTTTHRSSTATHRSATTATRQPAANPADNPPGVPKVVGTPKPLYSLRYIDTVIGTGDLAQPRKYYTVRYTGWLTDGTKFDSSDDHEGKAPITFPYGARRVIIGWDTGFEGMHVGGKRRLYIPYQLAYGETGRPPIPPNSDLIFDLELVSMSDTPPADVAPPSAAPTGSGTPTGRGTTQPSAQPQSQSQPSDTPKSPSQPVDPTKPTSTSPAPTSNTPAPKPQI